MIVEKEISQIKETVNKVSKDLHRSLLGEGKSIYVNCLGRSMTPFIKTGDRIKIMPVDGSDIKVGDLVAINMEDRSGAWFFVHRVVKIAGDDGNRLYLTKGDNYKQGYDSPVTVELIAGRITQVQRKGVRINLERSLWRYLNKIIARLSWRYPKLLPLLSSSISLMIEWRLFFSKVKKRLRIGVELSDNAEELLLICARKDLDLELKKKAADLIKGGLRWEYFTQSVMTSGLTILVYNALRAIAADVPIPQFVLDKMKFNYCLTMSKCTYQYRKLMELLRLFAQRDIPVLPVKGILLSRRLYGDIAGRGLNADLDLLIRERDKQQARDILEELGYQCTRDNEFAAWQWQYNFFKPKAKVEMVDLHWDISMMGRSPQRIEEFYRGVRPTVADGLSYYELKEEELLLYLSCRLVNSSCSRQLRYFCDINQLLRQYQDILDWTSIIEKAKRWRLSNSLYLALRVSSVFFAPQVPLKALEQLKPNFLTLILIKTFVNKKVILRDGIRRRLLGNLLSYTFFELIEAQSIKDYLSILQRVFFPPRQTIGNKGYFLRIFQGGIKLLKNLGCRKVFKNS